MSTSNSVAVKSTSAPSLCTVRASGSTRTFPKAIAARPFGPDFGAARRSAPRTRASSSARLNGLETKSSAPSSRPVTLSISPVRADSTMIGIVWPSRRAVWITSKPFTLGSIRSRITMSGRPLRISASPFSPSSARRTA